VAAESVMCVSAVVSQRLVATPDRHDREPSVGRDSTHAGDVSRYSEPSQCGRWSMYRVGDANALLHGASESHM
jgi:hypothetical protein